MRYLEDVGLSRDHAAHRQARGRYANHEEEHDDRERNACVKLRQGVATDQLDMRHMTRTKMCVHTRFAYGTAGAR